MVCNCPNSQTSTATSGFADRPLVLAFSRVPVSQSTLARCDHGQTRGLRFNPCGFNYLPLVVRSTPRKHADTECLDITPAICTCLFLSAITQSSFVQAQDRAPEPRDMPRLACTVFSPPTAGRSNRTRSLTFHTVQFILTVLGSDCLIQQYRAQSLNHTSEARRWDREAKGRHA